MKYTNKWITAFIITIVLVVAAAFSLQIISESKESYDGKLVVIHTNDIHGSYAKSNTSLGISSILALRTYYENLGANVLVLDAGDFSRGNALVDYFKGENAVDFLNITKYDAIALGNHEFDFGLDTLKNNLSKANFKVLGANVCDKKTGKVIFDSNAIFEFDNMKVGVFGLTTPSTSTASNPINVADLDFLDDEELMNCVQDQIYSLKKAGCDYIICLGHMGISEDCEGHRSLDIMALTDGIDLFVDGHSHSVISGYDISNTRLVSTGDNLSNIGVSIYDGHETHSQLINNTDFTGGCPSVDEFVASYKAIVDEAYAKKIGSSSVFLAYSHDSSVRTYETNLGDLVTDSYVYVAQKYFDTIHSNQVVDGAITNDGGIRANIEPGDITLNSLLSVLPFGNTVNIVTLSGAELLEALEASTQNLPSPMAAFPQVSGIEYTVDTTVPYAKGPDYPNSTYASPAACGSRVTIATVGGKAFNLNAKYNIAVSDFMAAGGDTYYILTKAANRIETSITADEALTQYVESLGGSIGDNYATSKGLITIK